jgi:hypothetical protein
MGLFSKEIMAKKLAEVRAGLRHAFAVRDRTIVFWLFALSMAALTGCSSKQLYQTGQAWQENQCFRIDDIQVRNRCLSNASISYEQYKRDSESAPESK